MKVDFWSQAGKILKEHKQYKRQLAVFLCLAVIVTFGTVAALRLYGQAMTHKKEVLDCKYEVHEHTEECYERDENGNPGTEPVCGYADYVIHVHNDECYGSDGEPVCTLEEHKPHTHTADCYVTEKVLICGEESAEDLEGGAGKEGTGTENTNAASEGTGTEAAEGDAVSEGTGTEAAEGDAAFDGTGSEASETDVEPEYICGMEVHKHDENCYENKAVCGYQEEHAHDESCLKHDLECAAAEHKHDDNCLDADGNTICEMDEHEHIIGCYDVDGNIICNEENHVHEDGCYDGGGNVICGMEQHEHITGCYRNSYVCGKEVHTHEETCFENVLTCELEEHEHTDECLAADEARSAEGESESAALEVSGTEGNETEGNETEGGVSGGADDSTEGGTEENGGSVENGTGGHVHTEACYEEVTRLSCGEQELHAHDDSCYAPDCFDEEGSLIEGSRPACGLLQLEEHMHVHTDGEDSCFITVELTPEEVAALNSGAKLHIHDGGCYDEEGNLICGHDATHIHRLECYDEAGKLVCGYGEAEKKEYICGKEEHIHSEDCYDEEENLICEKEEHTHDESCLAENEKTCEGDGYSVKVTYPDSAEIPENAELIVRQITEESDPERFAQRQAEAREALGNENITVHALFDIGFYVDGKEIEPKNTVNVTIQLLDENGLPEGTPMKIVHFAESGNKVLESGDIDSEGNANFDTDSFSEFVLVSDTGNIAIITGEGLKSDDAEGKLICGKEEHIHSEKCYDENQLLICEKKEHTHEAACLKAEAKEEVEKVNQLIAGLPSEDEIARTFAEYEESGEADEKAFAAYTEALTVQIQEAWDAYLGLNKVLREYVTGTDYLLALADMLGVSLLDEEPANQTVVPEYAAFLPIGEQPGDGTQNGMVLELLYGDKKSHIDETKQNREIGVDKDGNPICIEGEAPNYTNKGMTGNFKLYTSSIQGNTEIGDITLSLYFPKEYMDPKGIFISEFSQVEVQHQISQVTEVTRDGNDYYKISVTLKDYIPTGALTLPFNMKFKTAEVPADYVLKIFGTLERGEGDEKQESNPTAENMYNPKYEKPEITKYVNTNVYESMSKDYTRVSAKVNDDNIVEDDQYVSFWYKLGDFHAYLRAYDTITLKDTLPKYEDLNGNERYAVFEQDANPGWEIDRDDPTGHTIKRVFTVTDLQGENHWTPDGYDNKLMLAIAQAELKLKFPECKIDGKPGEDGFLTKNLVNHVEAVCEPYQTPDSPSALHEEDDTCEDDLIFTLTNQPGAKGDFTKGNSADTVMDTYTIRSGAYQWCLSFKNNTSANLVNVEVGDDVIDDRLKFKSIVVEEKLLANIVSVEAFTEPLILNNDKDSAGTETEEASGETESGEASPVEPSKKKGDIYFAAEFENTGTIEIKGNDKIENSRTLTLNPEKEYVSFIIHFKDGYVVKPGEGIKVWPYSTFRNPNVNHFVEGEGNDSKNVYKNQAYIAYQDEKYCEPGDTYYFLISENRFKLIECRENIWVEKNMFSCENMGYPTQKANGEWEYPWNGGVGNAYGWAQLYIKGSLADNKSYDDMRLIDLLPESLELYPERNGELSYADGYGARYVKSYETIENYHNSGRTALIIYLNVDEVRKRLEYSDGSGSADVYIGITLRVKPNAVPGNFTNDVYLVSKDFDNPPSGHGKQPDDLNIQEKNTDEYTAEIRWAQAGGNIQSIEGIYARKYIAKEGSNAWSMNALRLKVGDKFQYKLSMMNFAGSVHKNLVVYDVLPRIGDKSVNNQADRGSEFTVNLSGPILQTDANGNRLYPEGYQVYYTTSQDVYKQDMANLINRTGIWTKDVANWTQEDWNKVTAFKFVAEDGVEFSDGQLDFIIPVKVMDALTNESEEKLTEKAEQDRETGTAVYLEATNSFGYSTATYAGQNIESNWVKAQISFAGFVVKKTDEKGTALSGAVFKLEKKMAAGTTPSTDGTEQPGDGTQNEGGDGTGEGTQTREDGNQTADSTSADTNDEALWETIADNVTSDANGKVSFKNLAVGTYRLTETQAPDGYRISTAPITVTITFDDTTMEYTVKATGLNGSGTGKDPFTVVNETLYELPETGGIGSNLYAIAGAAFLTLGAGFLYKKRFRERRA